MHFPALSTLLLLSSLTLTSAKRNKPKPIIYPKYLSMCTVSSKYWSYASETKFHNVTASIPSTVFDPFTGVVEWNSSVQYCTDYLHECLYPCAVADTTFFGITRDGSVPLVLVPPMGVRYELVKQMNQTEEEFEAGLVYTETRTQGWGPASTTTAGWE